MANARRRRKRSRAKVEKPQNLVVKEIMHPFSDIDQTKARQAFAEFGAKRLQQYPVLVERLKRELLRYDPLSALAIVCNYGLTQFTGDSGPHERPDELASFNQHHAELLQAHALTINQCDLRSEPPTAGDISELYGLLIAMADAYHQRRLVEVAEDDDIQKQSERRMREFIRMHTQIVRNWGHYKEVVDLSTRLFSFVLERSDKTPPWSPTAAINIFDHLVSALEQRFTSRLRIMKRVFRSSKPARIVNDFCRLKNVSTLDAEQLRDALSDPAVTSEAIASTILQLMDRELVELYTFSIQDLARDCHIEEIEVLRVVDHLSLTVGSLSEANLDHFFLANPIWGKPLIRLDDRRIFAPMPQMFFSFILSSSIELGSLKTDFVRLKPKFLEEEVHQCLHRFASAEKLFKNFEWSDGGTLWENDHVALYDRHALLIEDKAGHISPPALRGALERAKYHVQEILGSGSIQSSRLAQAISKARTGGSSADLRELSALTSNIEATHRVTVTLHDLNALTLHLKEMQEVGWVAPGFDFSHAMTLADFRCLLDILNNPIFLFHYLSERRRLRDQEEIIGDELDWLALYLQTGFNFHSFEGQGFSLAISGMSAEIDEYYDSMRIGTKRPKPRPKIAPLWASIIQTINSRKIDDYINIGIELLRSASPEEQLKVQRDLKAIEKSVRKNWRKSDHICSVVISPPGKRDTGVIFYAYPQQLHDLRQENSENLATWLFSETNLSRCVIVGRNIDRPQDPYSFIAKVSA